MDRLQDGFASKAEVIYMALYEEIKNGGLRPGERLVEQRLADDLGVSKTPVREALRKLSEQGLVEIEPYRGARIAEFSIDTLVEIMEIRAVLEGLAARNAAQYITDHQLKKLAGLDGQFADVAKEKTIQDWIAINWEFHQLIAGACKNAKLIELLSGLQQRMTISSVLGIAQNMSESVEEHHKIFAALKEHDPVEAERSACRHVENTKRRVASLKNVVENSVRDCQEARRSG